MIIKMLRQGLGSIVVFIDWLFSPKPIQRTEEQQQLVNQQVAHMQLYQLYACPFCIKTRRALKRLNLPVETRNVQVGSPYRDELLDGGGRMQVPCLRMRQNDEDVWMYESSDIIRYLEKQFGHSRQ